MSKARSNRRASNLEPAESIARASTKHIGPAFLLATIAVLLYAPTWQYGFAGDDWWVIVANQWTRQGLSALPKIVSHSLYFGAIPLNGGLYRPVAGMYYLLVGALGGITPTPFHVTTTLLYGVNAALVFTFFARLGNRSL